VIKDEIVTAIDADMAMVSKFSLACNQICWRLPLTAAMVSAAAESNIPELILLLIHPKISLHFTVFFACSPCENLVF
jgi:hypothetical protein